MPVIWFVKEDVFGACEGVQINDCGDEISLSVGECLMKNQNEYTSPADRCLNEDCLIHV